MTHFYKSLVVVLFSFVLIFFMSTGQGNASFAAFMNVFNIRIDEIQLGPNIPKQFMTLIAIGVIGFIGIRRR